MKNRIMETMTAGRNRAVRKDGGSPENKMGFRFLMAGISAAALTVCMAVPAFADGDPLTVVSNLSTFIFGLIRAVGIIILAWGVVQVGMSFQSHDPSQRSQGFLTLAGGLVITFAQEILTLIGVS